MSLSRQTLVYKLGCLNLLLIFLAFFSEHLLLPDWLKFVGRMHPLMLHFPVAIILLAVFIYAAYPSYRKSSEKLFTVLFGISALTAVLSALFGLFLSREDGYETAVVTKHLWLGVTVSLLAFLIFMTYGRQRLNKILMISIIPVLVFGSHYGAVLTHGEDYLRPHSIAEKKLQVAVTDSSKVFASVIEPILSAKCYSCHNDKKAKGEFIMTSIASLIKGGKNGKPWIAGDPLNSHLVQRLQLPEEDKKHMPPRGKPQLTEHEVLLLYEWIRYGADMQKRFMDYPEQDSFRTFLASFIPVKRDVKVYEFPAADATLIEQIRSPYCNITPVSTGSPALAVRFAIRSGYSAEKLKELDKLSKQIVYMNCTDMPLKDQDLQSLKNFEQLETLILNGTSITGEGFKYLAALPKLHTLSISGTQVTAASLLSLNGLKQLKTVYCWNTPVDDPAINDLKKRNGNINWIRGYRPDPGELLQLTSPQVDNMESTVLGPTDGIRLKHPMPGVLIKYTLDGSNPDSLRSMTYQQPVTINKVSRLRAIATRQGWLTSDTLDRMFFLRSAPPAAATMYSKPDSNYRLSGISNLLDNRKGDINNIKDGWLGFYGYTCDMLFRFDKPMTFREIVVSTLKKTGPHIFPPEHIELWAGNDSLHLKKISSLTPAQPTKYDADKIEAQILKTEGTHRYYRIKVFPLKALPAWHDSKGKKVWIFLDEIFFN